MGSPVLVQSSQANDMDSHLSRRYIRPATNPIRSHDATADGSRFLVVRTTPLIAPPGEIHVVVHWLDELKSLMAAQGSVP